MDVPICVVDRVVCKRRVRHMRNGHAYVDEQTKADMEQVAWAYRGPTYQRGVPVKLTVIAYCEAAKSKPKKFESEPYTSRPDIDNIVKAVMDGLNGIAYEDDSQVVEIVARKLDRRKGGGCWTKFKVEPLFWNPQEEGVI